MQKKTILKTLIGVIIGILIIAILGIIILTTYVNPNKYKPLIIKSFAEATGRQLNLEGNIRWTVLPEFGLQADKISISNPSEFGNSNFADIDSVKVSIELLPLLHGKIVVNNLKVQHLKLALISNGKTNNWSFKAKTETASNKDTKSSLNFALNSFNLEDSQFSFVNTKTHALHKANNFSLSIKTGHFGTIDFNPDKDKLILKDVAFSFNHTLRGTIDLDANLDKIQYIGNINIPEFSLNSYLEQIKVAKPKLPNHELLNRLAFTTYFSGTDNSLTMNKIHLLIGNSNIRGQLNITSIEPLATIESFTVDNADLSDYSDINGFKLPMHDISLNGNYSINKASGKINALENLNVQNMELLGFNLNHFTAELDKMTSGILQMSQAPVTFTTIKTQMDQLSAPGKKNLNQKTNLGHLQVQILVREGIMTTPIMNLAGPEMTTTGKGVIDLNNKTINYMTYTHILHKNPLLNHLVFPTHLHGKLSDMDSDTDWKSIQQQVLKYYTDNIPSVGKSIKKAAHKTSEFFKKIF